MKLKSIKLAGFKTFVDPTKIPLQSNLVAIVGPNGCGKSNIIDAIRWVMGESSARQLRGDSVTDVIFNGSSVRNPVGQAAIELVFDNSAGSLGGEYANYAEIAIRRQVNRDGQSNYYLNGSRCRRRDIIDIFLGTGLGPRSYAIIEQGTIARLIEAKPDELRQHIEEAAGISKYKERRRETELRMQHTRDNLQRLADVRDEVSKQLERLQRQAKTAEQYKEFKLQERLLKAKLLGKRWQILDDELQIQDESITQQQLQIEAEQTQLYQLENQQLELQEVYHAKTENTAQLEREYYAQKLEISRLEQNLQHQQQRSKQLKIDLEHATKNLASLQAHEHEDEQLIQSLTQTIAQLRPEAEQAAAKCEDIAVLLAEAEDTAQHWQTLWDEHLKQTAVHTQDSQIQQTKIQHIEKNWQATEQRLTKLGEELTHLDDAGIKMQLSELIEQQDSQELKLLQLEKQFQLLCEQITVQKNLYSQTTADLQSQQQRLHKLRAQEVSLMTLQQEALGKKDNELAAWLQTNELGNAKRLAESIQVATGWELAVEIVLGQRLQAVGISELKPFIDKLSSFKSANLTLLELKPSLHFQNEEHMLLSKVSSAWPLDGLLAGVYVAQSVAEALDRVNLLANHETIITPEGVWLGKNWLHVQQGKDSTTGLLAREKELQQLAVEIALVEEKHDDLINEVAQIQTSLANLDASKQLHQQQLNDGKAQAAQINAQVQIKQARLLQLEQRNKELSCELTDLQQHQENVQLELQAVRKLWQLSVENLNRYQQQQDEIKFKREQSLEQRRILSLQLQTTKEQTQGLNAKLQTLDVQLLAKRQHKLRAQTQFSEQQQHCELLAQHLQEAEAPIQMIQEALQKACEMGLQFEQQHSQARVQLQEIEHGLKILEKTKHALEQQLAALRHKLEELKLAKQTVLVRRDTLVEQLTEAQYGLHDIQQLLTEGDSIPLLEEQLSYLNQRIHKLGAINLAAIEECRVEVERKQYLDTQHADLLAALSTLEEAIRKIDQETRNRFQNTFTQVNQGLQNLFPKLFGGGNAYLELTEDDVLAAGVNIMARPPGKRNSTIHLLSGGEKALTAVALVFAIFQLNPAPFCLLDEVDAPLDDANVSRFCNLLKAMADKVQFLFITHNKVTMETAEQLIGVTMREPGASRLVAVDIAEALDLAQA